MSYVRIYFDPDLPIPDNPRRRKLEESDYRSISMRHPEKYLVIFEIEDSRFAYYPESIFDAIADLEAELELLESCNDHDIKLIGYTILSAKRASSRVQFLDPTCKTAGERGCPVGGPVDIQEVRDALQRGIAALWSKAES